MASEAKMISHGIEIEIPFDDIDMMAAGVWHGLMMEDGHAE